MRQFDEHFKACPACGARLASMRRTLQGLARVERLAPPPLVAQQIRSRVAVEAAVPVSPVRRVLRLLSGLPLQPALRTSLAMGLTLVVSLFLVTHGVERESRRLMPPASSEPHMTVSIEEGYGTFPMRPTTSQVAGREFIWTDEGWVQSGLEGERPEALVDPRSPEGRAMLTRNPEIEFLFADGPVVVVLRYNLRTVELRSSGTPDRILGFEGDPLIRASGRAA